MTIHLYQFVLFCDFHNLGKITGNIFNQMTGLEQGFLVSRPTKPPKPWERGCAQTEHTKIVTAN